MARFGRIVAPGNGVRPKATPQSPNSGTREVSMGTVIEFLTKDARCWVEIGVCSVMLAKISCPSVTDTKRKGKSFLERRLVEFVHPHPKAGPLLRGRRRIPVGYVNLLVVLEDKMIALEPEGSARLGVIFSEGSTGKEKV